RAGAPHAEVLALHRAGRRARGARLYVNLEPCCHFGRTPPCVDAIIAAGVREVVACRRDPDPRVDGKGFAALRAAGVRVRVGALRAEASRLNERFLRHAVSGVPFVTLKAGMSLDGRIATRGGESRWITSRRSRAAARLLRARHDAVLVGVNTVLSDDPRLTAAGTRGRGGRGPVRVVLDARLRTPPGARLLRDAGRRAEAVILTLPGAPVARRRRLEKAGSLVLELPGRDGRIGLGSALRELGRRGVTSVLVEGGSEVLGAALDQGIGDRLVLFVAGRLFGGRRALPVFGGLGAGRLRDAVRLADLSVRPLGRDVVVEGRLLFPPRRRAGG
ncbi:MAG TPA: bifunctional diaminohydroxyphosphoribosylaminopyrimidine deaminase/5-amino-6-(5-phosphoribosylamino)uracil reductase RibD, partial [Candidatus Polarisedimenticolia bacterium]|nr:bifunctional diaminohydroxyphosphoribosylaminopyrimidine deaminase/5-amino-6-(5-phosphoribosylamino)uracil reductase RibD [Candidatus Polarisedimenticolia bacterium]